MEKKELLAYIEDKYQVQAEYLWQKFPTYAVFRQQANRKWFALVMTVPAAKLGLSGQGSEELLNVKLDPELVGLLKQMPGFLPAYHMNKATWISIRLKQIAAEQIKDLLAQSYDLTQK